MKDGTWKQKWAEYEKKREQAKLKDESEPQHDFYNVHKCAFIRSSPF